MPDILMRILKYFDLNEQTHERISRGYQVSISEQLILYLGILLGVVFSSVVGQYKVSNIINFGTFNLPFFFISCIIALIITPNVYNKLEFYPGAPFIVRLGLFVQQGIFWQVMLDSLSYLK